MNRLAHAIIFGFALAATSLNALAEKVLLAHAGLNLNANLETTGEDWQSGPVVLMTHGTLAHGRMEIMATLQPLLQERGISSLAITLGLGIDDREGMYDCQAPHNHRHADAVDEIGAWLDWLEQQGAGSVSLLGHSRGGNQTAWFAVESDRPSVQKLILVAPGSLSPEKNAVDYEKRFGTPLEPVLAEAERLVAEGNGDSWMEDIGFVYCENARATAAAVVGYYGPDPHFDTPSLMERIPKPVLVIAGSEDTVVPGLETSLAPLADNGIITLAVIDGADHMFRDLYADEVADAIESFLSE